MTATTSTDTSAHTPAGRGEPSTARSGAGGPRAVTRVLHGAGNVRQLLPMVRHPSVDAIEADVWVRGRRVVAHHERPLDFVPLVLTPRGPRLRDREPVDLPELLDAVGDHSSLVLDVRSWFNDPAPELVRVLAPLPDRSRMTVTCESWAIADRLREWLPDLFVAYSVRSERELRRYIEGRAGGSIAVSAVAIRHTLLRSQSEVEALHRFAERISAWTVDDVDRGIELAGWGVDAIVSNRLTVLNSV